MQFSLRFLCSSLLLASTSLAAAGYDSNYRQPAPQEPSKPQLQVNAVASSVSSCHRGNPAPTTTVVVNPVSPAPQYATPSAVRPASSPMALYPAGPSASPVTQGSGQVQVVKVSNKEGALEFFPKDIKAAVGSMVQFQFYPKNHSIVQASFDGPCVPLAQSNPALKGFFSGFMPTDGTGQMPVYTVQVQDEKPMWFYCSQGKHCQSGMVGVINAPASGEKTVQQYIDKAKGAAANVSPGGAPTYPSGKPSGYAYPSGYSSISAISPTATSRVTVRPATPTASTTGPAIQTVNAAPGNVAPTTLLGLSVAIFGFVFAL